MAVGTRRRVVTAVLLFTAGWYSTPAEALEINGGVAVGGRLAGTVPRLAVSPNVGVAWRMDRGFTFAVHDLFSLLPPTNGNVLGVDNQTSVVIGYAWRNGNFSAGPSLSIYSIPACGVKFCAHVLGLAPGGSAQGALYLNGPLGVSVLANVDWVGGSSSLLPGGVVAMVVAGPVLRWDSE